MTLYDADAEIAHMGDSDAFREVVFEGPDFFLRFINEDHAYFEEGTPSLEDIVNENGSISFEATEGILSATAVWMTNEGGAAGDLWDAVLEEEGDANAFENGGGCGNPEFGDEITLDDVPGCGPPPEPADPTNQGPTTVPVGMPLGGVAGLALLIVAGAAGGASAVRRSNK
jgi:hypothetical protein